MLKMKVTLAALLLLFPMAQGALAKGGDKNKSSAPEPPTETRVSMVTGMKSRIACHGPPPSPRAPNPLGRRGKRNERCAG